jgi:hypothetical protein
MSLRSRTGRGRGFVVRGFDDRFVVVLHDYCGMMC